MGNYVKAASVSDLKDGEKEKISISGHEIMLARVGNKYYAINNRCPHLGGNLSHGKLEGTVITCPLHGSQYDITGFYIHTDRIHIFPCTGHPQQC